MPISRPPSSTDFRAGLLALEPIREAYLRPLRAHYHSPSHTSTVTQIADALTYKTYHPVNLVYGKFVKELGVAMGYPTHEPDDYSLIAL